MPAPRKYEYSNKEELAAIRRERDRISHFINFWKKNYNIVVNEADIDFFKKNKSIIKQAIPIINELRNIEFIN